MLHKQTVEEQYLVGKIGDQDVINHYQAKRQEVTKSEGAVYTPAWIVNAMLERIGLTDRVQKIVEPSAGHGSFALPLIRYAQRNLKMTWAETAHWFINQVDCFDIDAVSTQELRSIVSMLFAREGIHWVAPETLSNIKCHDGLDVCPERYDIAIGNPPYIRTQNLPTDYRAWIRERFDSAKSGNIDIYYAFLDHYISSVPRCVFIVPNGCIKATGARALREKVFPKVGEIVDFQSRLIFPNARTYTCILSSSTSHKGQLALRNDIDAPARYVDWRSITGAEIHSAPRIAKSGLATLADPVFTVRRNVATGLFYAQFDGKAYEVEKEIVRPLYKITKLSALEDINQPERFIIFPYRSMSASDLISESELEASFPKTLAYLTAVKAKLLSRDRGKADRYPSWFAYGRTQGLHDLSDQEVVFIPTMIGGASRPKRFHTGAVSAAHGSPLFVSGFAVTQTERERDLLMSEEFIDYVRANGTPKPGATELYYAISSKHVNAFLAMHDPCPQP